MTIQKDLCVSCIIFLLYSVEGSMQTFFFHFLSGAFHFYLAIQHVLK